MAISIPEVQGQAISHAVFIDLTLDGTTYYLSSAYKPITHGGNTYTELGALLQVSSITEDLKTTNGDITVSLSGIPSDANYMNIVLNTPIKGGEIVINRGFFNTNTMAFISGAMYERYRGIITNYSITEEASYLTGELAQTISITCASLNTLLESKVTGQRTNGTDRKRFYPGDISFDRVKALQNTNFDFGREYRGGTGYGGGGGGGTPGGPGSIPKIPF